MTRSRERKDRYVYKAARREAVGGARWCTGRAKENGNMPRTPSFATADCRLFLPLWFVEDDGRRRARARRFSARLNIDAVPEPPLFPYRERSFKEKRQTSMSILRFP